MNGTNRLGTFTLYMVSERRWEDLLPLFGNFVIVEARYRADLAAIEYLAYSGLFEEIPQHTQAPRYELEVAEMPDGPAVIKAHRRIG